MKRYTSSQVRERFAEMLDAAEKGEEVIIERRGVRYVLRRDATRPARRRRTSMIAWMDPAVEAGQWTWELGPNGLEFVDTRSENDSARHQRARLASPQSRARRRAR
jgi:antitoxin (DNA-binding transcriptional repressor) of toxin-antitoxin stability system